MIHARKSLRGLIALLLAGGGWCSSAVADTYASREEEQNRFGKLNFHRSILQADVVAVGEVAFVTSDPGNTRPLVEMLWPQVLFGEAPVENARAGAEEVPAYGKAFLILLPERFSFDTPLVFTEKRNLVFLKKLEVDELFLTRYSLPATTVVYEACDGWQSAVQTDLTRESPASKLLKERYSITTGAELVQAVGELSSWRSIAARPDQIAHLVKVLNTHKTENLYLDNIPPLLLSLGVEVTKLNGEFVVKTAAPQDDSIDDSTDKQSATPVTPKS